MGAEDSLPDYYAILQVHLRAEAEVIEAAYRRLMRKYHPDALSPELKHDLEILQRVQSINAAYDVLSDPQQRAAYDRLLAEDGQSSDEAGGIETRTLLVRCATTRQTYQMLVGCERELPPIFRVLGFQRVEDNQEQKASGARLALPNQPKTGGWLHKILGWVKTGERPAIGAAEPAPRFPSQAEIREVFQSADTVSFTQIDWGYWVCPDCQAAVMLSTGTAANWCYCNTCRKIYCAGNIHATPKGDATRCPWCRRNTFITSSIQAGDEADLPVRGGIGKRRKAPGSLPLPPHRRKELP